MKRIEHEYVSLSPLFPSLDDPQNTQTAVFSGTHFYQRNSPSGN